MRIFHFRSVDTTNYPFVAVYWNISLPIGRHADDFSVIPCLQKEKYIFYPIGGRVNFFYFYFFILFFYYDDDDEWWIINFDYFFIHQVKKRAPNNTIYCWPIDVNFFVQTFVHSHSKAIQIERYEDSCSRVEFIIHRVERCASKYRRTTWDLFIVLRMNQCMQVKKLYTYAAARLVNFS